MTKAEDDAAAQAADFQNMLTGKIKGILKELGYTPQGQPGAAPAIDPKQLQQVIIQAANSVMPGYLQKIVPGYVDKLVAAKSADVQGMAQTAVAAAVKNDSDLVQARSAGQLVIQELGKVPGLVNTALTAAGLGDIQGTINGLKGQLEQIAEAKATSVLEGYATKVEVEAWKTTYESAKKAFEDMTAAYKKMEAAYKEMGTSNQAKEKELAGLKEAVQEAKNTFAELKPVYEEMVTSNKAKDVSYKKMEAAYQKAQSTLDELQGKVNALEGLEERVKKLEGLKLEGLQGRIVKAVEAKVKEILTNAPSGTGGEDIRVAATAEVDAYLNSEAGRKMIEGKFDETFEKRYRIKPLVLRKLIRYAIEQGWIPQPEQIEEAEPSEGTGEPASTALPQQPSTGDASGEEQGYLGGARVTARKRGPKKKAKDKKPDSKGKKPGS